MPHTRSLKASKSSFFASTRRQISSVFCMRGLLVSEAGDEMIVHHSGRLHECVAYGGPDEAEAAFFQRLAHQVRNFCRRGQFFRASPTIDDRLASDERPQIGVQAAMLGDYGKRSPRVVAHREH